MPARRKSTARRTTARKPTRAKSAKKAAARKAPAKAGGGLDGLARKIVRATVDPTKFSVTDLYTADCVSEEVAGPAAHGHSGIEQKLRQWESMQRSTKWKARNVVLGRNVICIEWDAEVTLNDGRVAKLPEVAIHEVKGGKIARERFYYNPAALAPPQG